MNAKTRISVYIVSVSLLAASILYLYTDYSTSMVDQQLQQLLGISQAISRSMQLFAGEVQDSMKIVTLDDTVQTQLLTLTQDSADLQSSNKKQQLINDLRRQLKSYCEAEANSVFASYLFNAKGIIMAQYPYGIRHSDALQSELLKVTQTKQADFGQVYFDNNQKTFILNLYQPIFAPEEGSQEVIGVFTVAIKLNEIYDRLIRPVQIGKKGYAQVKDQNGTIIMHLVKDQVGINVIETRKQLHPELDFKELERLIAKQMTGEEGTHVYHSYWWADKELKKAKKLNAFSPVQLGDHFWVVAVVMSYDEIAGPIQRFLIGIIFMAILIALMIHFSLMAVFRAKQSKEALEKETAYLKMLNESTEQLRQQESELYHSQKLKMVGTLAGGMAHDINNLLTPILGYSELLLHQISDTQPYHEEILEIYNASQRGKDLIEQILLFSRKDNGLTRVAYLSMAEVTRETLKLLRVVLPKNLKLQAELPAEAGYVKANYTQLHQVIFNLCSNAYHATKDNDGSITVSLAYKTTAETDFGKDCVELTIRDTGCGMDAETLAQLYEPFFTTKETNEGTGLGLFVVKSIIDKYLGTIQVDSRLNEGTQFIIRLPAALKKPEWESDEAMSPYIGNTLKLLVVDDNEDINRLLKKGLEYYGYEVETETDSVRAYDRLINSEEQFDLLITDYKMPRLTGTELARKIRAHHPTLGIILITGYMEESRKSLLKKNVVDAVMAKPIELSKLSEMIRSVLSRKTDLGGLHETIENLDR